MTEWNLEEAIKMWNSGKSAKEIADCYGVTRNTVIGRIHRARYRGLDVKQKVNPSVPRPIKPRPAKPGLSPKVGFQLKLVKGDSLVNKKPAIYDLEPGQCKYSTGESEFGEYVFCGKPHTNKAYCDEHHKLCHTKPEPRKKNHFNIDLKRKFLHYR